MRLELNPAKPLAPNSPGVATNSKPRLDETTDGTTSHLTRLSKNDSQVIGYSHSTKLQKTAAKSLVISQGGGVFLDCRNGKASRFEG